MQVRDLLDDIPMPEDGVILLAMKQLLREELNIAQDWQHAEGLLLRAIKAMPEQLPLQVALYKLYAYSNRFGEALELIGKVLQQASSEAGFAADWRQLTAQSTLWQPATGVTRLYLYSLKATGFVSMRAGDIALAEEVLNKLQELDPQDQVGGSVVREIVQRLTEDEGESCFT